jgi:hypothetical protein
MKDPIVEEVRKHRMDHTRKFGGDLAAICSDLQKIEDASGHKIVRLKPRRVTKSTRRNSSASNKLASKRR